MTRPPLGAHGGLDVHSRLRGLDEREGLFFASWKGRELEIGIRIVAAAIETP